jgi:DNA topoisomerase-2
VAQFSGYVSEQSCYHHGEESLNKAIVGMAQNFVGSNNINILFPSGQFGSRIRGGQDASSPRYIFTRLEKIARAIFPEEDDAILKYLNDDGTPVEPQFYAPIIPMILINGSKGIGTGFSTEIMCYNPQQVIAYLKNKLASVTTNTITDINKGDFVPFYEGFKGAISKISDTKFLFRGSYHKTDQDKIVVTELPVGFWTEDFKELLNDLQNDKDQDGKKIIPLIKDVYENYTDTTVEFAITLAKGKLDALEKASGEHGCNGLEKLLKLYNTSSTTNMNLFNEEDKLKKYNTVEEIIDDYYVVRLSHYSIRKEHMINTLQCELIVLSKKKTEITDLLNSKQYDVIDNDEDFKYLVKMPMDSVSEENVEKLLKDHKRKLAELDKIMATSIQQMWLQELAVLEQEYELYREERQRAQFAEVTSQNSKKKKVVKKMVKRATIANIVLEESDCA